MEVCTRRHHSPPYKLPQYLHYNTRVLRGAFVGQSELAHFFISWEDMLLLCWPINVASVLQSCPRGVDRVPHRGTVVSLHFFILLFP